MRFTPIGPRSVLVSSLTAPGFTLYGTDVADAQGRAKARVKLGVGAGTELLEVSVPELGATDTVTYTVKPGPPAKVVISPSDTSIKAGASFTLTAQTTDRFLNPLASAVPTLSATGVAVSPAGVVTAGNTTARGRIVASYQGFSDSASVWVIPKLPLVVSQNKAVVLVNTDGTGATTLVTARTVSLSPSSVPATPSVVYYQGGESIDGKVWVVEPNGTPRLLLPGETRPEGWPRLSPDGTWVYFVREQASLWRAHVDGTGLDSLTSFATPQIRYAGPTISPDGRYVAVQDTNGVQIFDVTTRTSRTVAVTCGFPRYSPDGAYFACLNANSLWIVRTDGTGERLVANLSWTASLESSTEWSPDGQWLLVSTVYPLLVEVSTGTIIVLRDLPLGTYQALFVR